MQSTHEFSTVENRTSIIALSDVAVAVMLGFAILLGGFLRLDGNNWDDFFHFHPDERYLTDVATALGGPLIHAQSNPALNAICMERYADGVGGYFDPDCSPYNPENIRPTQYVYGTLPLFVARIGAEYVADQTDDPSWLTYNGLHLVWRAINGMADTIVILLVFLIGLRVHDKWVGAVAALLYAGAVLPIQLAHFGTADAITNLFVTLAIFFAVRTQYSGSLWDYGGFGLALGAAVASRVNVAPLAAVIVVVAVMQAAPAGDWRLVQRLRSRLFWTSLGGLVLAAVLSLVVFRLTNPYAFSGPGILGIVPHDRYIAALEQSRYAVSGEMDWAPNWQWVNRTPYLFAYQNMILWGLGLALGITATLAWVWSGWQLVRGKSARNLVLFTWTLIYFVFAGGLWVMSMRYYLPLYPVLAVLAAWLLVELVQRANRVVAGALLVGVVGFTLLWAGMFTNIYRSMATFVQASHWVWENIPGDFSMQVEGTDAPLINIPIFNSLVPAGVVPPLEDDLLLNASRLEPNRPIRVEFTASVSGMVTSVQAHRLVGVTPVVNVDGMTSWQPDEGSRGLRVTVTDGENGTRLAVASLVGPLEAGDHPLGQHYSLGFDQPLVVEAGQRYTFSVEVLSGGTVLTSGGVLAREPWDEPLPSSVCELPTGVTLADDPPSGLMTLSECRGRSPWAGLINGYEMEIDWEDVPAKQERMQYMLDTSDYILIATNRRYDSQTRNPMRWPMTVRYYDALFSGELGFEVAAMFQESFELGPLKLSDQHLPIYDSPDWLNAFEPEEAFHVYDHPVVFIFEKTDNYNPANTRAILFGTPLTRVGSVFGGYNDTRITDVITWSSLQADKAPTYLMFTDEMQETQAEGGTWSDRFDADNFINQNQFVALVLWWLMIVVFGIVTWPLLFVTFPALADRGYGFAKMTGMVIVAFVTWALATMRIPAWNQTGILVVLLAMTALSVWITWRNRGALAAYIRERWSLLIWIEAIMLVMFLMFVGVRMTNPDLWHYGYGGEKPMDFAYFNGVLRSTVFPPIDPWFAGGYINYYYFGFVIVGVPTLLLGVVPSIAYNLIVPTLFSITGIAAFSLAYSIVNRDETRPDARRMGNPWVAGFMALLLAVVLGNLDTVRVIGNGVAALGGHTPAAGLQAYLIEEYTEEHLIPPDEAEMVRIQARAQDNRLDDRLRYEFDNTTSLIGGLLKGFGNLLRGQELRVSSERWFWGPTRVIAEIPPPDDGAINEMPYFTFLYGDLHAHMIALPMMFFVMAFVYHELVVAGYDKRRVLAVAGAIILGGGMVGLLRATNTWDYPTFTILSVAGLGYAWWLAWRRFSRWSLLRLLARVGGFVLVGFITALPFTLWFSTALTQFKIWEGQKTPLWAYIDIHGLFLFLVVSFMAWETVHWLRSVRVSALRGQFPLVMSILSAGVVFLLAALILSLMGYPIGLIVVPLVAWIALLFFRPGQTRQVQYILVLFGLGLAITLGTEFITLTNDNGRQNTIFKFYIQVWLFFSIAGGVALAWLVQQSSGWRLRLRAVWYGVAAVLIFIAALYPLMATRGKAAFRMAPDTPVTLDGMEYMKYTTHWEDGVAGFFSFNDDYRIIRWLQENVEGSPTIMEAVSGLVLYQWGGRISINTGLPSVVGWDYHQQQQRSLNPLPMMVSQRVANVNAFYTTRSIEEAVNILRYYDIEYVIFSSYEQERYLGSDGLEKFPDMIERGLLEVAYEEGRAVIYRVNRAEIEQVWRQQLQ